MKKFNKITLLFIVCIVSVALLVVLAACDDPNGDCTHEWFGWSLTTTPTQDSVGSVARTCSVCSESQSVEIPALSSASYTAGNDTATCSAPGTKSYTVTIPGYDSFTFSVNTPATGNHNLTAHGAVNANCTNKGAEAYWECSVCNKKFGDEDASNEIANVVETDIDPDNHNIVPVNATPVSCKTDGNIAHYKCTYCNTLYSDADGENVITAASVVISKDTVEHTLTPHVEVPMTCVAAGTEEYWSCEVCEKLFSDANGENNISEPVTIAVDPDNHNLTDYPEIPANCVHAGTEAYWYCTYCHKYYSDENGNNAIEEPVEIPITDTKHELSRMEGYPASCRFDGMEDYYICGKCNAMFSDADGLNKIEMPVSIPASHSVTLVAANSETKTLTNSGGRNLTFNNIEYYLCSGCGKKYLEDEALHEVTAVMYGLSARIGGSLLGLGNNTVNSISKQAIFQADAQGTYIFEVDGWLNLAYLSDSNKNTSACSSSKGWDTTSAVYSRFTVDDPNARDIIVVSMDAGDMIYFNTAENYYSVLVSMEPVLNFGENSIFLPESYSPYQYEFTPEETKTYLITVPENMNVALITDPNSFFGIENIVDPMSENNTSGTFEGVAGETLTFEFMWTGDMTTNGLFDVTIGEPVEAPKLSVGTPVEGFAIKSDGDVITLGEAMSCIVVDDSVAAGRYTLTIACRILQAGMCFGVNYQGSASDFVGTTWVDGEANLYYNATGGTVIGENTYNISANCTPMSAVITLDLEAGDTIYFITNNRNGLSVTLTLAAA